MNGRDEAAMTVQEMTAFGRGRGGGHATEPKRGALSRVHWSSVGTWAAGQPPGSTEMGVAAMWQGPASCR